MRVISQLVCFITILALLDTVRGDFASFVTALPKEIRNAFSKVWTKVSDSLRRPIRIKRLGKGGKKKITPLTTERPEFTTGIGVTKKLVLNSGNTKVINNAIPIIPKPTWQSFSNRIRKEKVKDTYVTDCGPYSCHSFEAAHGKKKMATDGYNSGIYNILFFV